jgi:hypothetical protein
MNKMNAFEKTKKIKEALKNAILAKENTTDISYHLEKSFKNAPKKEIKKLIKNFNIESLKENHILNIKKSELDKRFYEYRVDNLHQLCQEYAIASKQINNINLEEVIADEIAEILLINSQYCNFYLLKDINNAIRKKLKHIFGKSVDIEKRKGIEFTFTNAYSSSTTYLNDIIFDAIVNVVNERIDEEKINEEIKFIYYLIKNFTF